MKIQMLKEQLHCDETALIISSENRTYFTDFTSSNGYLIVSANGSAFITDSRYIEAAKCKVKDCDEIILQQNIKSQLAKFFKKFGTKKISIEAHRTTIASYNKYKELFKDFEIDATGELDDVIDDIRKVKSQEEKEKIIKAQRITEKAFKFITEYITQGKTERDVARELDYAMFKNGADALSFKTIVASGENSSKPHAEPSDRKLKTGDFITMDFGACYESYHSDMTRTVALGNVSTRQAQVYDIVLKAQQNAIQKVRQGVPARDCDMAARKIIDDAGYQDCFGHSTGHGVGIEIHEGPVLSPSTNEILKCGNIVTAEPGIYIEGKFGVRIEDMLFVTEDGNEDLTNSPKALMVL